MAETLDTLALRLQGLEDKLDALAGKLERLPRPVVPHQNAPKCVHRGPSTGEKVRCLSCRGTQLVVFSCAIHGKCTLTRKGDGTACCNDRGRVCPDLKVDTWGPDPLSITKPESDPKLFFQI